MEFFLSQKLKGALWGFCFEKSLNAKKLKGEPLVSPGMVCYAEKPFWFSSLSQMIQFGPIKVCRILRTILASLCGLKKNKSHYNTRVSLHEAPTKKMF